jgi:hypothetical protein
MTGTSETGIFEQDGQYLSMTAEENITLGQVVKLVAATPGNVEIASDGTVLSLGVAIAGNRVSRDSTDNVVASGNKVTVCTRGIVNVTCTGTVTCGELVQCDTAGTVKTLSLSAAGDTAKIFGLALSTGTNTTVKIKIMRG